MKHYCCLEHVELALDIIVDECETAPMMKALLNEEQLSTTCEFCDKPAIYLVTN
ncbi:CxxH/CxxC protein [Scopulibacillus darangshiensis]|uniref:CxxH/CxxC protein n=1 Tax=Scopulibacillus darangshiensis TaxID=442528 RepID=UPI00104D1C6F|nr:CxxH/CxxC protein [Scopulibacillus darangshiensis]